MIYHNPYRKDLDFQGKMLAMRQANTDLGIVFCLLLLAGSRKLKYIRFKKAEKLVTDACNTYKKHIFQRRLRCQRIWLSIRQWGGLDAGISMVEVPGPETGIQRGKIRFENVSGPAGRAGKNLCLCGPAGFHFHQDPTKIIKTNCL